MYMDTDSANLIDLEEVALELLRQLKSVMPPPRGRFVVDELDAEQEPGMTIESLEKYAIQYCPKLNPEYKDIILKEFGYTF